MAFNSVAFLFVFLPAVLLCYFILPARFRGLRNLVLLAASLCFYAWGGLKGLCIFLASLLLNYIFGLGLGVLRKKSRRLLFILAVAANLGLLGFYKYGAFFASNLQSISGIKLSAPEPWLPLGLSFYTFQSLSYLFDVYRERIPTERNFLALTLYQTFFPKVLQGPIVRYENFSGSIRRRQESLEGAFLGFRRFAFGLAKKMLLANSFGQLAGEVFTRDITGLTPTLAWMGIIAYSLQIYFDFSGYSDMALGLGRIFGFSLPENFNYPYLAESITDFWRRWHITLSQWFRDYIYIPLGGNRRGKGRQILNLLTVWGLTGLWHGAAWTFVAWGLYFAVLLILEKLFLAKALEKLWRPLRHVYALFFILIGWVIFQSPDFGWTLDYLRAMFTPAAPAADGSYLYYLLMQYRPELIAGIILCMPFAPWLGRVWQRKGAASVRWEALGAFLSGLLALILFLLSVLAVVSTSFSAFLYFQF